jgi:hypothetical protein
MANIISSLWLRGIRRPLTGVKPMSDVAPAHSRNQPGLPANVSLGNPPAVVASGPGGVHDVVRNLQAVTPSLIGPTISILNSSKAVNNVNVAAAVNAMQEQLDRDFLPVWGATAQLKFAPNTAAVGAMDWLIEILDNTDTPGALGYHDITANGAPYAKIFAETDIQNKLSWTVTLSHELLEMVMDPYVDNVVFDQTVNTGGVLYAFEMCDPVEDDSFSYLINGVKVSDFVWPAWFQSWRKASSTQFDQMRKISKPFALTANGYASVFPVPDTQGWIQIFPGQKPGARLALKLKNPSSRSVKRMMGGQHHLTGIQPNLMMLADFLASLKK